MVLHRRGDNRNYWAISVDYVDGTVGGSHIFNL